MINTVKTKAELVSLIESMAQELKENPERWENPTLDRYLEALASWLTDSQGYYQNMGLKEPVAPSWKDVADMLLAARIYE